MKLPRRAFLPVAAGVAVLPVAAQVARAQAYPAGGLPNTINVADFGARGNGRTDDTAALNAAFASVFGQLERGRDRDDARRSDAWADA
jgi:Pectate lyase superfamily protein